MTASSRLEAMSSQKWWRESVKSELWWQGAASLSRLRSRKFDSSDTKYLRKKKKIDKDRPLQNNALFKKKKTFKIGNHFYITMFKYTL